MNFKKKKIILIISISLMMIVLLTGCKSKGTDRIYNDNNEISKEYDTFGIDRRKETIEDGVYKGNLKISGTNTIWQYKSDKNFNLKVLGVLSVKGGKGKIVFISPDNKVINIAENKNKEVKEYNINVTVPIKKGLNRIKVVGYDKADINMEIHIDEGKFQKIEFESAKNIKENQRLRNNIVETIKNSKNIDLKEVTNFKWDTMYVFTPYSNPKDILKENIDFSGKYSDGMYMIAFIDNNRVSEFIELPNSFIKVDINEPIKVSRDEAKFNIHDKVMIIKTTGLKGEELKLTK